MNNSPQTKTQLIVELKIRDTLDQVRDRALAMQSSDEISDVATAMFNTFHDFGFNPIRSGIAIIHEADEELEAWFVRGQGDLVPRGRMALGEGFENPQAKAGYQAWKQDEKHHVLTFTGEEAENVMRSVVDGTNTEVGLPDGETWPDQVFVHWLFFPDGYLFLTCLERLSDEALQTAKRFAEVFGLAYCRFVELKTKEEQNRELTIQNALERVRAQALSMEGEADLMTVSNVLFESLRSLGFHLLRSTITVVNREAEMLQNWMASEHLSEHTQYFEQHRQDVPAEEVDRFLQQMHQARAENKAYFIVHVEGDELTRRYDYFEQVNNVSFRYRSEQEFIHTVFFEYGYLTLVKEQELTEADLAYGVRFAKAFEFAYDRYLQLKEKEAQNRALQEANKRLEEATRLKSQFLATMSHELRTPMNAIIGFTRLVLRRADNLADRQRENLEKVKLSADHLLNLINEILDLSKIEAGRIDIQPAPFDLKMLIANCCATVGPTLGKPSVTLSYDVADDAVEVFSDEARLRQIVINLLSNALKFTDEGEVSITVKGTYPRPLPEGRGGKSKSEDGQGRGVEKGDGAHVLEIAVRDTGVGIPEDQLEAVFEEFRQVDGSSTRKIQGTGLGLAITKKLVELLGGTISVTSVMGEGSTFTFCIPARYGEAVDTQSDVSASGVQVTDASNRLIVSIDDDPNVAVLLRQELEEDGYQVISALNADEGIALVKKHKPVAVTVDILMPGKDGWQTIAALKADADTRDVPVIVVSAIENKELGFSLGIHDYIVKPFDHDALVGSLKRLNPQGMRDILVVEDEPSAADLLCQMLEGDGFTPRTAYNGRQALACIEEAKPDAIFLDLMMPDMDGFEVIEQLQSREDWKRIPVIVVTAKDLTIDESNYLNARVSQVIQKGSLDSDVLENTLQNVLERYSDKK